MKIPYSGYIKNILLIVVLVFFILYVAKSVLIPLVFGIFFTLLLEPLASRIERIGINRTLSTGILIVIIFVLIALIIFFFSAQIVFAIDSFSNLIDSGDSLYKDGLNWIANNTSWKKEEIEIWIEKNSDSVLSGQVINTVGSIIGSSEFLFSIGLVIIYTILFLIYRSSLKNFLISQYPSSDKEKIKHVLKKIKLVVRGYLSGLGIMVLILCVLNSLGLWIAGVKNPVLWGVLAAFLAIVPYIGNLIGASFPFLQSLISPGYIWQPLAVLFVFIIVQQIEGNFITPKIVGNKVHLNPLAAIVVLIVGATLWGISGMILAIPITAVIKIICDHTTRFKSLGLLLGDELYSSSEIFTEELDGEQYRMLK